MSPTLTEAIAALVAGGARRVAVVPIFLAQGGHLKRDLPVLLDEARAAHPGCEITLATAAGEADPVVVAMADYALGCLR
jgi:sirohydrochlorin cobaltochelatase